MIPPVAQIGIPGGPELLIIFIIFFIFVIPLVLAVLVVIAVLLLRRNDSGDEERIEAPDRAVVDARDEASSSVDGRADDERT